MAPQGLQNIKQSPTRLDAGRMAYEALGVIMTSFFMTTGQYDMVAIVEAPDDVTLSQIWPSQADVLDLSDSKRDFKPCAMNGTIPARMKPGAQERDSPESHTAIYPNHCHQG